MTKDELIAALQALDCPGDTEVAVFDNRYEWWEYVEGVTLVEGEVRIW